MKKGLIAVAFLLSATPGATGAVPAAIECTGEFYAEGPNDTFVTVESSVRVVFGSAADGTMVAGVDVNGGDFVQSYAIESLQCITRQNGAVIDCDSGAGVSPNEDAVSGISIDVSRQPPSIEVTYRDGSRINLIDSSYTCRLF